MSADQTELVSHDEHAGLVPHHLAAFAQDELNHAWVFEGFFCQLNRFFRRFNVGKGHQLAFSFRNNFLRQANDISVQQGDVCRA